jgi:hypothetical protein
VELLREVSVRPLDRCWNVGLTDTFAHVLVEDVEVLSLSRPFLSRANPASSWTVTKTRRAGRCECRSWPADSYPVFGSEHIDALPRNCIAQPRLEPGYARAVASPERVSGNGKRRTHCRLYEKSDPGRTHIQGVREIRTPRIKRDLAREPESP